MAGILSPGAAAIAVFPLPYNTYWFVHSTSLVTETASKPKCTAADIKTYAEYFHP
jgi:hypothetical protein